MSKNARRPRVQLVSFQEVPNVHMYQETLRQRSASSSSRVKLPATPLSSLGSFLATHDPSYKRGKPRPEMDTAFRNFIEEYARFNGVPFGKPVQTKYSIIDLKHDMEKIDDYHRHQFFRMHAQHKSFRDVFERLFWNKRYEMNSQASKVLTETAKHNIPPSTSVKSKK